MVTTLLFRPPPVGMVSTLLFLAPRDGTAGCCGALHILFYSFARIVYFPLHCDSSRQMKTSKSCHESAVERAGLGTPDFASILNAGTSWSSSAATCLGFQRPVPRERIALWEHHHDEERKHDIECSSRAHALAARRCRPGSRRHIRRPHLPARPLH